MPPTSQPDRPRSRGEVISTRYQGASDEIDFDRTFELLLERQPIRSDEIIVRERRRDHRAVALLIDVSGSMRGPRARTAAAAVGALASELRRDDLAVIAFWSDAALLLPLGAPINASALVDALLAIPAAGLTNIAFPLEVAAEQLRNARYDLSRAILLSDCVHNAGPDPRPLVGQLRRLDVLLDLTGEHDADLARDLAHAGRGRAWAVRSYRDVAPALNRAFER